jgi:hypothetical protein
LIPPRGAGARDAGAASAGDCALSPFPAGCAWGLKRGTTDSARSSCGTSWSESTVQRTEIKRPMDFTRSFFLVENRGLNSALA